MRHAHNTAAEMEVSKIVPVMRLWRGQRPSGNMRWARHLSTVKEPAKGAAKSAYFKTLNITESAFPMRANCVKREPMLLATYGTTEIYRYQKAENKRGKFVLLDGPPFANGPPHLGHALNKILKDIVVRFKVLQGFSVTYAPGWDCHGLPIELKASKSGDRRGEVSSLAVRQRAREVAMAELERQKTQFRQWGVMADWDKPYLTMSPDYEAAEIGLFWKMYQQGLIYQAFKPVYWSPSSRTALAEAELEYNDNHVSTACYVKFPLASTPPCLAEKDDMHPINIVIWTTTPWTLPANRAVAVHPDEIYNVVQPADGSGEQYLVVKQRLDIMPDLLGGPVKVQKEVSGKALSGATYKHPYWPSSGSYPVLSADYVSTTTGTGLVHMAPAHGLDDYNVCMAAGVQLGEPLVDDDGLFTHEVGEKLAGLPAMGQGTAAVVAELERQGRLLSAEPYTHRYPYDWRSKRPVMMRATKQWFCRVAGPLRQTARQCLEHVDVIPPVSRNRFVSALETRDDWCLSRQRVWGLPIPVFYQPSSGEVLLNARTVAHVQSLVRLHGADCWWALPADELLPPEYCNKGYVKGQDTLDVWFDSGAAWTTLNQSSNVADVVLEGSDQHRGWFQSSLLTSVAANGKAPFKTLISHGFVLDQKHRKMSKSVGNVVDPASIVNGPAGKAGLAKGADTLRLWVASSDYTADLSIGPAVVDATAEALRKVRNTVRFMLNNLVDFSYYKDNVETSTLLDIDRYMLGLLLPFVDQVTNAYETFNFNKVVRLMNTFVAEDLSAFYLDVIKDRLYEEPTKSHQRRSAQTTLFHLTDCLAHVMAPILPFLAEDIWMHFTSRPRHNDTSKPADSIMLSGWAMVQPVWLSATTNERWTLARQLLSPANKLLEQARHAATVKAPLDAALSLKVSQPLYDLLRPLHDTEAGLPSSTSQLTDLFRVSATTLLPVDSAPPDMAQHTTSADLAGQQVHMALKPATGHKCPRCWKRAAVANGSLCPRCQAVVEGYGMAVN